MAQIPISGKRTKFDASWMRYNFIKYYQVI